MQETKQANGGEVMRLQDEIELEAIIDLLRMQNDIMHEKLAEAEAQADDLRNIIANKNSIIESLNDRLFTVDMLTEKCLGLLNRLRG
jgi:uncharacterized coiled-coil DUF342 family protein